MVILIIQYMETHYSGSHEAEYNSPLISSEFCKLTSYIHTCHGKTGGETPVRAEPVERHLELIRTSMTSLGC